MRRCWITTKLILRNNQHRLVPQAAMHILIGVFVENKTYNVCLSLHFLTTSSLKWAATMSLDCTAWFGCHLNCWQSTWTALGRRYVGGYTYYVTSNIPSAQSCHLKHHCYAIMSPQTSVLRNYATSNISTTQLSHLKHHCYAILSPQTSLLRNDVTSHITATQ